MSTSAYQLTKDAYVCLADSLLVFSDLRDDKYRCLNRSNTQAALRLFPGFQGQDAIALTDDPSANFEEIRNVARVLADNGLLIDDTAVGKPFTPVHVLMASSSLISDIPTAFRRPHFGHWISFLQACLKASGKLRLQTLRRTVRSVEGRKRRHRNSISQDDAELRELVLIFHHLRPYYMREYLCRFDSLALVEFLAHYHHFPQWVFGVKSDPFHAHCWVQESDCVLNDSIDCISRYTPIMVF